MATVTEIVTKFSFLGNLDKLTKFNGEIGGAISKVAKMAVAVKGASATLAGFTTIALSTIEPIANLASETGVGIERVQELGYAASVSGSSIADFNSTLTEFSKKVGEASFKNVEQFKTLGINVKGANGELKSTDDLLLEVGGKLRNLSNSQQIEIASKLGINRSVIGLITQSSDEIQTLTERARRLGVVSEEQARLALRTNDAITTLKFGLGAIAQQIAIGFAPQLENMAKWFVELLEKNRDLIIKGFSVMGKTIDSLSQAINRLLPTFPLIIAGFLAWKVATLGVSKTTELLNAQFKRFLPVLIIAGLLLLLDDLIVAFRGGKSVIRDFFLEFLGFDIQPLLKDIWQGIKDIAENIKNAFKNAWNAVTSVFKGVIALFKGDTDGAINHLQNAFQSLIDAFYSFFKPFIDWGKEQLSKIIPIEVIENTIDSIIDIFKSAIGVMVSLLTGDFDGAIQHIKDAFNSFVNLLYGIFTPFINWVTEKLSNILPDWALDLLGIDNGSGQKAQDAVSEINKQVEAFATGRMQQQAGNTVNNSSSSSNATINQNINISTADVQTAARVLPNAANNGIRSAAEQVNRGGR